MLKPRRKGSKVSPLKYCILFILVIFVAVQVALIVFRSYGQHEAVSSRGTSRSNVPPHHSLNHAAMKHSETLKQRLHGHATPPLKLGGIVSNRDHKSPITDSGEILENSYNNARTSASQKAIDTLSLPAVSLDESELILNSIIERTSDSWGLHLTTFFVSRAMLDPEEFRANKAHRIRQANISTWNRIINKLQKVEYLTNGRRSPTKEYFCRLTHQKGATTYVSQGYFLPNRQTTDSNANRRQDILRCPMEDTQQAYHDLARSSHHLSVEILREDDVIARFTVPWNTRRTGYLLSSPPEASRFDAWKGYTPPTPGITFPKPSSRHSKGDDIYLCTPNYGYMAKDKKLYRIIEFIQHHSLLGVNHIFLSSEYAWGSHGMRTLLAALTDYISEGSVSISSEAGDNINLLGSTEGILWHPISLMNFHLNSCLFLSKGTADYVGVWDLDEFFIPKFPHNTLMDVIHSATKPPGIKLTPDKVNSSTTLATWHGGQGWADGDGHPFCYMSLFTQELHPSVPLVRAFTEAERTHPWLSRYYISTPNRPPSTPSQSILPTDTIFQGGMHVSGACRLSWEWTGCDGEEPSGYRDHDAGSFCYSSASNAGYLEEQFATLDSRFPAEQRIDYVVFDRDVKRIDMNTQGVLYKTLPHVSPRKGGGTNDYVSRFSPGVEEELRTRYRTHELYALTLPFDEDLESDAAFKSQWPLFEETFKPAFTGESSEQVLSSASENGVQQPRGLDFPDDFAQDNVLEKPPRYYLPAFATDYTDIALGSLIERAHDSWNLHLTTFFLSHNLLWEPAKGYGMRRVGKTNLEKWKMAMKKFNSTQYELSGIRSKSNGVYKCRISNTISSKAYEVEGHFMPNSLTPDLNANKRVDIFRCKIKDPQDCYRRLTSSDEQLNVEIIRNDVSLFHFRVPWKTRRHGFLLSNPSAANSFQAWKGYDPHAPNGTMPGTKGGDSLYMTVPGIESPISQKNLPMYAEFLQHHYLLGVEHVFLAGTYSWNGPNMARLLTAFRSYIDEGLLSVHSQAGDNIDLLYSILGTSMDRDNIKIMYVNMCLYLTKGVVDYLAIWDIDEYFIPRLPHNSIMDVVHAAESTIPLKPFPEDEDVFELYKNWKGGRGWADGDAHPFCYLMLFSEVIYSSLGFPEVFDPDKPWVGYKYPHLPEKQRTGLAFKKSIIPTRLIFQAGLHMHGACSLPNGFRGYDCAVEEEFCYVHYPREQYGYTNRRITQEGETIDFSIYHKFDSSMYNKDAKRIDPRSQATIYHFQIHRTYMAASNEVLNGSQNEYVTRFFPRVLSELKRRGLNILVTLPDNVREFDSPASEWVPLHSATVQYVLSPDNSHALNSHPNKPIVAPQYPGVTSELPHFVTDQSDVILGGIIEREHDSWDLYLTTFFMAHEQLANRTKIIKNDFIRPDTVNWWMKAIKHSREVKYTEVGMRNDGFVYLCRISNFKGGAVYLSKGVFVPNELTPDVNANKRLDILRCPLKDTEHAYRRLSHSNQSLFVEILKGTQSIVNYTVPWISRRTGFMLSSPPSTVSFDAWKGFEPSQPHSVKPDSVGGDELHMCVPGIESPISKKTVAMYGEFLQHHFSLGVQHIHAAVTYTWGSKNMNRFLEAFQSYIDDGLLSVVSEAGDEDLLYGFFGMSMDRDNIKIFFVNMCLYLTKGVAEYLAIWDIDEYFIPKPPHHTIMDVVRAADSPTPLVPFPPEANAFVEFPKFNGGRGWADKDGHPLCYFMMTSEVLYRPQDAPAEATLAFPWVGSRFTRAPETQRSGLKFKKPILPTRKIYQGALHMAGGCKLDYPFSGCEKDVKGFCYSTFPRHRYGLTINWTANTNVDFSFEQRFDGLIMDKDAKKINSTVEAVIYHFQIHRSYFLSDAPSESTNDYVQFFFPHVVDALRRRGIELLVSLPAHVRFYEAVDETLKWPSFHEVYAAVAAKSR